jgi:DNA-directed RNA polymerase specialized sigma24 family protein
MARVVAAPFGLTGQQREWYESLVPDVPEEAVAHIVHEWGCAHLEDDLLQEAYLGTVKGVETFDTTKGALRQWVFFSALHAALAVLRRENRHSGGRVVARIWDGLVEFCKGERQSFGVMGERDDDRTALTEFRSRAAAAPLVAAAILEVPTGGGDAEMVSRLTAARCAEGLAQALGNLSERRHELLRSHFADDTPVKEAAAARGERGYRAELAEFHRTLDLVAARLAGMGFLERPPFPAEAGGTILRESAGGPSTG